MNKAQKDFFKVELQKAKKNGIKVELVNSSVININGDRVTGYFDSDNLELKVAQKRSLEAWLSVFVHESCHMDQFLERARVWNCYVKGKKGVHDAYYLYDAYLDGVIDLSDDQRLKVLKYCIAVELDCEKRSVAKMKEYDLGIDTESYIRKANSYCYAFSYMSQKRKWHSLRGLYRNNKDFLKVFPTTFHKSVDSYIHMDPVIFDAFEKSLDKAPKNVYNRPQLLLEGKLGGAEDSLES